MSLYMRRGFEDKSCMQLCPYIVTPINEYGIALKKFIQFATCIYGRALVPSGLSFVFASCSSCNNRITIGKSNPLGTNALPHAFIRQ